jgi:predicted ATP-dependent endonuclease of OLD family
MKIDGIKIINYRSFDEQGVKLDDFGNINVFIGKNNSGKSNIIRFISKLYQFTHNKGNILVFEDEDYFHHDTQRNISFSIIHKKGSTISGFNTQYDSMNSVLNKGDAIELEYEPKDSTKTQFGIAESNFNWFKALLPNDSEGITKLRNDILHNGTETSSEIIFKGLFDTVIRNRDLVKKEIYLINNYRKIERDTSIKESDDQYLNSIFNGNYLITELNKLRSPKAKHAKTEKEKLEKIEKFIKDILNTQNINVSIDSNESELSLFGMPLNNLGTGVHQLLILALSVTIRENCIFCIEEPEIFLHPEIQRKFINFLLGTKNQYFITTHSNSFINIAGINLYHVTNDGSKSSINRIPGIQNKNQILDDLGYKASDMLQTNYLLWVEGPTDRIYINHWLQGKAPDLIEGIHYSIMFYGGDLRSHLTVNNETVEDFINLNRINRKTGIVQDSDIKLKGDEVNKTKKRIIEEFEKLGHFCWLTEGREIENYVSQSALIESCKTIAKSDDVKSEITQFDKAFVFIVNGSKKELEKLSLAREVVKRPQDYNVLDLNKKIESLITEIKRAN